MKCISKYLRIAVNYRGDWATRIEMDHGIPVEVIGNVKNKSDILREIYWILSRFPCQMIKDSNISKLIIRSDMGPNRPNYPNHGYYLPSDKSITLNADIFNNPDYPKDFYNDHTGYFVSRPEQTLNHEIGHAFDFESGHPSLQDVWMDISGWSKEKRPGLKQLVIKDKKFPRHSTGWYYNPDSEFTRFYGKASPEDDFADCFAFYIGGMKSAVPSRKRKFLDNLLSKYFS